MKTMTYAQARFMLMSHLLGLGWDVRGLDANGRNLKVPYCTSPDGRLRLWFKPQAVWYSYGNAHTLGDARSLHCDIRRESPAAVVALAVRFASYREHTP